AGVQPVAVSGLVTAAASSEAPLVQFYVDGSTLGDPATGGSPGSPATASTPWSSWSFANGAHAVSAADCDGGSPSCNATQSPSIAVDLSNSMPSISLPADNSVVWGDVTITASSVAPRVQF